jgi:flagellar hook-associated protein 2
MFSVNNAARMRMGGVNSGTDVEAMVKAMGMNARQRINNNQRRVLQLQAQQNAYREVITRLQTFQRSFFDNINMSNNLRSTTVFNQTRPTVTVGGVAGTPVGVTVTSGSGATATTYDVKLVENASQARLVGNAVTPSSQGEVNLSGMVANTSYGVTVRVGSETRNLVVNIGADASDAGRREALNTALRAFGTNNAGQGLVSVDANNRLSSQNAQAVSISGFAQMDESHTFTFDAANAASGANSFNIQVGGARQTVTFNTISVADFQKMITECDGSDSSDLTAYLNTILARQYEEWVASVPNRPSGMTNGVFDCPERETMFQAFLNANPTPAGSTDEAHELGLRHIYATQEFGVYRAFANVLPGTPARQNLTELRGSFTTAGATAAATAHNREALANAISSQVTSVGNSLTRSGDSYTLTLNEVGTPPTPLAFSLTANAGPNPFGGLSNFNLNHMSFSNAATIEDLDLDADVDTLTINGRTINITAGMSLQSLANAVNNSGAGVSMSFSSLTNRFVVTATSAGAGMEINFGGTAAGKLGLTATNVVPPDDPGFSSNSHAGFRSGTNLVLEVNGSPVETSGNSFTVDGTTFAFAPNAVKGVEFSVEVGRNTSAAAGVIKDFVEAYNALIRDISLGKLQERPNRGHHFLTDWDIEQAGMTETQVAQWNTLSNKGLLYRNTAVTAVMTNIRMAMMMTVTASNGRGFGLHSILGNDGTRALSTSVDPRNLGQIEINEQALIEALERDGDNIMALFTGEHGLASRVNNEINRAINTMGPESSHGTLIRRAGLATGITSSRNALHSRITSLNDMIRTLEARYEKQQDRFWRQFTNMERQFASLNAQSDQIGGFFMGLFQ